jgi:hypothetical protein
LRAGSPILIMMLLAAAAGCDESTAPEEEGFILEVTVTDTLGQPLEGMAVWRQSHLEGTIPNPPSAEAASTTAAPSGPMEPDSLIKIYPNPFNGVCEIKYSTSDVREIFLEVKDWRGRHVKTVLDGVVPEGPHQVQWNQKDESLERVMTGVYMMCLTLTDTLDTHLFTYSSELKCTAYDDFFSFNYWSGWTLGQTDGNGFLATRDLEFFPSLQGHGQQWGYDENGDHNGIFGFSETVTIRISTIPEPGEQWIYYMSRDIDLVDGPNYVEFAFVREDSMEVP